MLEGITAEGMLRMKPLQKTVYPERVKEIPEHLDTAVPEGHMLFGLSIYLN